MGKFFDRYNLKQKEAYHLLYTALCSKKEQIIVIKDKVSSVSLNEILIGVLSDHPEINYAKAELTTKNEGNKVIISLFYKESTKKETLKGPETKGAAPVSRLAAFLDTRTIKSKESGHYTYYSTLNDAEKRVYNAFLASLEAFNETCCFKKDGVPSNKLILILNGVLDDNPFIYYVENALEFLDTGFSYDVKFSYSLKKSELIVFKSKVDQFLKRNFEKYRSGYSDYEKVLVVHDFMTKNMKYLNDGKPIRHNVVGPILENIGVCEGFSETARLIGGYLGVEIRCIFGTLGKSTDNAHMWNIVCLDGSWYHMDLTSDIGNCEILKNSHSGFLVTDASAIRSEHDWEKRDFPKCTDTKYDYYKKEKLLFLDKTSLKNHIQETLRKGNSEIEFKYSGGKLNIDEVLEMGMKKTFFGFSPMSAKYLITNDSVYLIKYFA